MAGRDEFWVESAFGRTMQAGTFESPVPVQMFTSSDVVSDLDAEGTFAEGAIRRYTLSHASLIGRVGK